MDRVYKNAERRRLALLAFGLGTAVAACGNDDKRQVVDLRTTTFNAGLAPGFVPYTNERAPLVVSQLASLPTDILCVQEMWREQDRQALIDAAAPRLPNVVALPPEPAIGTEAVACQPADLAPLATCATTACSTAGEELGTCVLVACGGELGSVPPACQRCLAASVGGDLQTAVATCTQGPGELYAYGGSFGTALLTDAPLLAQDSLLLDSTLNRRAVLYADVNLPGLGPTHVFCTHLTADLALPYPGEGSWEAEQAAQIEAMLTFINEKSADGGPVLLMGDLNTGPAGPGVVAEVPANYGRLVAAGFANRYLTEASPTCTFCADNPLVVAEGEDQSVIIDHILTKRVDVETRSSRVLDAPVSLQVDGQQLESRLSDHYGVELFLRVLR